MKLVPRTLNKALCTGAALLLISGCATSGTGRRFNPKTCLKEEPAGADTLRIIHGPRTNTSIASDMHPAYCNGQVLLKLMNEKGEPVNPGTVWFKVSVEYTGEVVSAQILKSEIGSKKFLQKVSDMIMNSDFSPWQRHDRDSEFIYPMTFYHWWE